nr:Chain C, peptide from HLA-DPA1 protein [synthetic construct]
EEFGAAFSF